MRCGDTGEDLFSNNNGEKGRFFLPNFGIFPPHAFPFPLLYIGKRLHPTASFSHPQQIADASSRFLSANSTRPRALLLSFRLVSRASPSSPPPLYLRLSSAAPPSPPSQPHAHQVQTAQPLVNVRRSELNDDLAQVELGADLDRFEEMYMKECMKTRPDPTAKFNYAWALIRSRERANIKKGVIMMQGLLEDRYADRDCLYYMALGYYRLEDVVSSRKCLDKLLKIAPNCRQAISLMDIVEDKITKDGVIGISIVSGIAVVGGLLVAALAGGRANPR
ncbi:unnamed protein product [Chondrus crispus]|uniref:Mitochondrial fission 1 protein n=1 Tax=Chondrus crispus TaxID=2769 RepID=R7QIZ6_CHOCR|nr:unnamed protein product [Chondrus crispus]CDF37738.1 unnamed protein product [Chondrus crispus]|eukprot:XP_005717609.1 unnamed protein product [Chondrus crispus]